MKGGVLDFKKESRALAQALGDEHGALGDLLNVLDTPELEAQMTDAVELARESHSTVEFQKKRADAARGTLR
jgi:hypothetical protein